jgi:hypothetical protein
MANPSERSKAKVSQLQNSRPSLATPARFRKARAHSTLDAFQDLGLSIRAVREVCYVITNDAQKQ